MVDGGPHTDEVLVPQKEEGAKIRWCGKLSRETSPERLSVHVAFCYYLLGDLTWMDFVEHGPHSLTSYHKPYLTTFPPLSSEIVLQLHLFSLLFGPREPGAVQQPEGEKAVGVRGWVPNSDKLALAACLGICWGWCGERVTCFILEDYP